MKDDSLLTMTNCQQNSDDLNKLTDLNSRLFNFLNLVKSETQRGESLKTSLVEKKREYVTSLKETNCKSYQNLLCIKKYLNELCFSLNSEQVKERHHRILMEWFSKLLKFEQDNLRLKPKVKVYSNFFNEISYFSMSSSESEFLLSQQGSSILLSQSSISSSQTSLSSLSSSTTFESTSSSSSSSANSTTNSFINLTQPSEFSLEEYLTSVKTMRSQLEFEYDKKYSKFLELKENTNKLNSQVDNLNLSLDTVKIDNSQLSENVCSLRKEVEFYSKLKQAHFYEASTSSNNENFWYNKELDRCKKEASYEFEQISRQTMNAYEECLEKSTLEEIEAMEREYDEEMDVFQRESDQVLNELSELNTELNFSVEEYTGLLMKNHELNERLANLSTQLGSFGELSQPAQERLILNYSIKNCQRDLNKRKSEIKSRRQELSAIKETLIRKDINEFLSVEENNDPMMKIIKSHFAELKQQSNKLNNWSVQNHHTQIEYTKSNLFAYLTVNFDVVNYSSSTNTTNKQNQRVFVNKNHFANCHFRVAADSIDGHSIIIENNHRILDFDLSGWTMRREILNCAHLNESIRSNFELLLQSSNVSNRKSGEEGLVNDVVEFTFPKGFRLKRRKKINLIAAGGDFYRPKSSLSCFSLNNIDSTKDLKKSFSSSSLTNNNNANSSNNNATNNLSGTNLTSAPSTKCSCCACKTLATRKGGDDMDVYEAKEMCNWGTGLLVVTKFINTKNVIKLINYRCLKQIWLNERKENV